jgi:hypothetical protein
MTIYLYKKTHNKTGLNYLGKTTSSDPHSYQGSGIRWRNHINIHGYDVTTEILKVCSSEEELRYWGIYYSSLWNVVESENWANLMEENGAGGLPGESTRKKLSDIKKGKKPNNYGKKYCSGKSEAKKRSKLGCNNPQWGIPRADEVKEKLRQAQLGIPKEEKICPHCGKTGGGGSMIRWHFDNCKLKKF